MLVGNARATFFTRTAKVLGSLAVIAALCGCEVSRQDYLSEARAALADAAYDDAVAAAEAGLQVAAASSQQTDDGAQDALDDATSWGLELAKLEAYARAGHGEEAKAQLAQLASLHPNRVEASAPRCGGRNRCDRGARHGCDPVSLRARDRAHDRGIERRR
jgi:hypothetical protein